MHLREQVVVEEGAEATDVQHSRRARRVPHPHAILTDVVRAVLELARDAPGGLVVLDKFGLKGLLELIGVGAAKTTTDRGHAP